MSHHYERMRAIIAKVNSTATHHAGVSDAISYAESLAGSLSEANARIIDLQLEPASLAAVVLQTEETLDKAMAVVEAVLEPLDHHHECDLCTVVHPDDGGDWEHGADCPLVNGGFIDKNGKRLY